MKVINIFGGPGTGKSTQAAALFVKFKKAGLNVELVTEYAKDMTWENRTNILTDDQVYIFAKQHRRILRLRDQVDYVITDAPFIMGLCYSPSDYFTSFEPMVKEAWDRYDNVNYYLERQTKYTSPGRTQDESQAIEIDGMILSLLQHYKIPYKPANISDENVADTMFDDIINS